jgi:hypothetical protein
MKTKLVLYFLIMIICPLSSVDQVNDNILLNVSGESYSNLNHEGGYTIHERIYQDMVSLPWGRHSLNKGYFQFSTKMIPITAQYISTATSHSMRMLIYDDEPLINHLLNEDGLFEEIIVIFDLNNNGVIDEGDFQLKLELREIIGQVGTLFRHDGLSFKILKYNYFPLITNIFYHDNHWEIIIRINTTSVSDTFSFSEQFNKLISYKNFINGGFESDIGFDGRVLSSVKSDDINFIKVTYPPIVPEFTGERIGIPDYMERPF